MGLKLSTPLLSQGTLTAFQAVTSVTAAANRTRYTDIEVWELVTRTIYWCRVFGFNHDIVLSQMVHETNYFRFTGDVKFGQHNMAGLGATGGVPGHSFPSIEAGVLAVVAHHAAYRYAERHKWPIHLQKYAGEHIDPRYDEVLSTKNAGRMIVLGDYRGTWAVPGTTYPESLLTRYGQMNAYPRGDDEPMTDVPNVAWHPADGRHHRPGRIDPWPYYLIQHHTDGFDSLNWLTINANSEVSANYLFKNDGTIRAQMVRHKDTPWTTGRMNDDSISAEWERYWTDPVRRQFANGVPDNVYRNIGASWSRIVLAERERKNPHFQGTPLREQMRDHNDFYDTVCPGNLDMDRVYHELVVALGASPVPLPTPEPENPDGKFFEPTDHWIINGDHNGLDVPMLDFYESKGGIVQLGLPLSGMWMGEDGVFRQVTENAVLEFWSNGYGNQSGHVWRFGRYLDHVDRIT